VKKCKLYAHSLSLFGSSPFIYPKYGLGGIPEGFSRLCAVAGGVQMLEKKIQGLEYGEDGKVNGVKVDDVVIKTKMVLADPTYLTEIAPKKIVQKGSIVRSIVFMKHPVPKTNNADALQLIIPFKQVNRKNDIYVTVVSAQQAVAAEGWYIAVASTVLEGSSENAEVELKPAFELLGGNIREKFTWVSPYYEPASEEVTDNVFVTASMDPTSHFEVATDEVLRLFKDITGTEIDLNKLPENDDDM
jgi:Rab GDP dissociation inhibitor